jgi:energy-coupling factor transporter ATP-binding protein EcfA2
MFKSNYAGYRKLKMNITIKNCNNVENAIISIKENSLNIKYAINGTGKTTISQAISYLVTDRQNDTESMRELKPFKYADQDDHNPEVLGAEQIRSIKVFDENYVNDFVFLPNELLRGSFDIFIRDENYENGMKEIDNLVETLRKMLADDKDIDDLIKDFNELSGSFGKPTKTGIHGSSTLSKALKHGNKIINIPEGLDEYKDYIQNENNYKWIKWQIDGRTYLDISEKCPYCTNNIKDKKTTIKRVSEVYDSKSVENLNMIIGVFQRLNRYFSDETKSVIDNFIKNVNGYSDDQVSYLREIKDQIDRLNNKFVKVQEIGFKSLKDVDKVIEGLKSHYIDLNLFNHLQSESTQKKADIVNNAINALVQKAGELQGSINKQKRLIEKLVKENSDEINGFLKNAGYQYHVAIIEDEEGKYKLKLIHNDIISEVSNVKTHLSFGERNAFSLVLFMYDALRSAPDLIVLDDPISSFDKNKKYAIIDMLFRKEKGFRGKTVLLLTHDFEPIVDMVYHHSDRFAPPYAVFLENICGELYEKTITRPDIKTFIDINNENIQNHNSEINKLVYLRRLYEVTNKRGLGYQLISNLLHKRDIPIIRNADGQEDSTMTLEEINLGTEEIQEKIPNFSYQNLLRIVKDDAEMKRIYLSTGNNYERLHIYRIIFDDKKEKLESDIIQKFINEAFHLENDYIYQINPCDYQLVPQYVIDECDKYILEL